MIDKACSRPVRYRVLRNQTDRSARRQEQSRDVAAEPPPLAAVVIAADADDTGTSSFAHVTGSSKEP